MKKKANETNLLKDLLKMAEEYGVDKNPMFIQQCKTYALQQQVIELMKASLDESEVVVTKEYVKSRENLYASPIIKELPKHTDAANKTAANIVDLIKSLGQKRMPESSLKKLMER